MALLLPEYRFLPSTKIFDSKRESTMLILRNWIFIFLVWGFGTMASPVAAQPTSLKCSTSESHSFYVLIDRTAGKFCTFNDSQEVIDSSPLEETGSAGLGISMCDTDYFTNERGNIRICRRADENGNFAMTWSRGDSGPGAGRLEFGSCKRSSISLPTNCNVPEPEFDEL